MNFLKNEYNKFKTINNFIKIFIVLLIIAGLYIRIINLTQIGFVYDTNLFKNWASFGLILNPISFWKDYKEFFDYLPSSVYYLSSIHLISNIFNNSDQAFLVIFKFFNLLIDCIFFILIIYASRLYGKYSITISYYIGLVFFLSPALWFVSGFWGQIDTFIVLMAYVSIILLYKSIEKSRHTNTFLNSAFWSGAVLGFGFLFKLQIILIIPALILFHLSYKNKRILVSQIYGIVISTFIIIIGPIIANYPLVISNLQSPLTRTDYISNGAQSFWTIFGHIAPNDAGYDAFFHIGKIPFSVSNLGLSIYLIAMTCLIIRYFDIEIFRFKLFKQSLMKVIKSKHSFSFFNFVIFMTLSSSLYFIFFTRMHERYFQTAVIFSIIVISAAPKIQKNKKWWILFVVIINLSYFLNLLNVYFINNQYIAPLWVSDILNSFSFDSRILSSVLNTFSVVGMYMWAWRNFKRSEDISPKL